MVEIPRDSQAGRANAFAAIPALKVCGRLASAMKRKGRLPPCRFAKWAGAALWTGASVEQSWTSNWLFVCLFKVFSYCKNNITSIKHLTS